MCELCLPPMTRRRVLALAGAATGAVLLGRPDPTAAARSFQTEFGVDVEPRATWAGDSRPYLGEPRNEDVRFLLVHHTAGPSEGDPIELIRQVHEFHTGADKGWPDVAYNFFVEPGGRVFEGRTGSLEQAVEVSATGGNQGYAQLVCLLGDFTNRNPTEAQLASLNGTLAWLANRYVLDTSPGATAGFTSRGSNKWPEGTQVTADIISGHREMSSTACPGDTFYPYLKDRVQAEVHAVRGNPQAPAERVPADTSAAPVPASTRAPLPTPTAPTTAAPVPESPVPAVSTTAAPPSSTLTLPTDVSPSTTTGVPAPSVSPTVAAGPVISPPAPRVDESAVAAPQPTAAADGRPSSSAATWALGAGGVTVAVAAAVYVAVRGDGEGPEAAMPGGEPLAPPPGRGDSPA